MRYTHIKYLGSIVMDDQKSSSFILHRQYILSQDLKAHMDESITLSSDLIGKVQNVPNTRKLICYLIIAISPYSFETRALTTDCSWRRQISSKTNRSGTVNGQRRSQAEYMR